jgi:membrane protein involved in colicin uptake
MNDYANTVKDVSRAIAQLDVVATSDTAEVNDAVASVASNLAYQFARHNGWGGRKNVTQRDVRAALISHGASTITVEQYARRIASTIRADFTDGRAYHA